MGAVVPMDPKPECLKSSYFVSETQPSVPFALCMSRNRRGTQLLFSWPLFILILLILLVELILYASLRLTVWMVESVRSVTQCSNLYAARRRMENAKSWNSFKQAALKLDKMSRREPWKRKDESRFYDYGLVQDMLQQLNTFLLSNGSAGNKCRKPLTAEQGRALANLLGTVYNKNLFGVHNEELYFQTYVGTKDLIQRFVTQSRVAMQQLRHSELPLDEKLHIMARAKKAVGTTSLCLSGGAANGYFHLGVMATLLRHKCLPKIISGTSSGSMVGAWAAVRTDKELEQILKPELERHLKPASENWLIKLKRLLTKGVMFDNAQWAEKLKVATKGDTTFLEAYRMSGRIFNVATAKGKHQPAAILNYITTPHVVLWSAVLASCALPCLLKPGVLMEKKEDGTLQPYIYHGKFHRDGSIISDIPVEQLSEIYNTKFFIVSQVNPHVVPWFF